MVARSGQHALDLMIFSLLQHDFDLVRTRQATVQRSQRGGLVVKLYAGEQLRDKFRVAAACVWQGRVWEHGTSGTGHE